MAEQDVLDKLDDVLGKIADNKEKINEVKALIEADKSIQQICAHCGGDGMKGSDSGDGSCPDCGGDGVRPFGRITLKEEE